MQDPLRDIFEIYEEKIGSHAMAKDEWAIWDWAQAALGEDAIDEMFRVQSRWLLETEYDFFREGFRLGVRLILGQHQGANGAFPSIPVRRTP